MTAYALLYLPPSLCGATLTQRTTTLTGHTTTRRDTTIKAIPENIAKAMVRLDAQKSKTDIIGVVGTSAKTGEQEKQTQ